MSGPRLSIIPARAATDTALKPRDLQVLCVLGRHTNDLGWCRKSQVKMAKEMGCARSTVFEAVERLVKAGYLERHIQEEDSGRDNPHVYRVILDPVHPDPASLPVEGVDSEVSEEADTPAGISAPLPVYRHPPAGSGPAPKNDPLRTFERESARENGQEGQEDDEPSRKDRQASERDFKSAFNQWPTFKFDSEGEARREWARLTRDEQIVALEREADYVAEWKESGRKKQVAFSRYLAERRWERLGPKLSDTSGDAPEAAAPFGKSFMAKRLTRTCSGPTFTSYRLTNFEEAMVREGKAELAVLQRAKQASAGFPAVNDMDRQRASTVSAEIAKLGADFVQARKGDQRYEAWRAEHLSRGWPWIPDWVEWVWLPPGEPAEAVSAFEQALARIGAEGERKNERNEHDGREAAE